MGGGQLGLADVRELYDAVATRYAELIPDLAVEAPLDLAVLGEFVTRVPDEGRVLDAGCGAGRLTTALTGSRRIAVSGTDLSPAMIDIARREHPGSSFAVAPLTAQPFPDDAFDGVVAWYSIIHTAPADLPAVLREFARVLRQGGSLLLGFQAGSGVRRSERAYGLDVAFTAHLHDPSDVEGALLASGFDLDIALRRGPRASERHSQGFVLARKEQA